MSIAAAIAPGQQADGGPASRVLCVDLDGTLLRTDLLWECFLSLLKRSPLSLFLIPYWLLRGRAHLKIQLALRASFDVRTLPYRRDVIQFLEAERIGGCRLVLVSGCEKELALRVAAHLELFDAVFATEGRRNLSGRAKAKFLREQFGDRGFEYIGDSRSDLIVWRSARAAYVAGNARLCRRAAALTEVKRAFPVPKMTWRTWIRAARGQHWFKNVLLFLPAVLAHEVGFRRLLLAGAGFFLFGMCASGLYVLNDLLDLHSDREHPWKQKRPFAAGEVSISRGLLMAATLLLIALSGSFLLDTRFGAVLVLYAVLTFWYSLHLKKIVLLDAFVLSSFYVIRLWAGAVITLTPLSHWFLSFSLFFFLSLAMAKRYSELLHAADLIGRSGSGRGYLERDQDVLMNLGIVSGFSAVVIFTLYVRSPEVLVLYHAPQPLLLLAPLLAYWISRLWLTANRGELNDDPLTLALRDPASYAVAGAALLVIAISMVKPG